MKAYELIWSYKIWCKSQIITALQIKTLTCPLISESALLYTNEHYVLVSWCKFHTNYNIKASKSRQPHENKNWQRVYNKHSITYPRLKDMQLCLWPRKWHLHRAERKWWHRPECRARCHKQISHAYSHRWEQIHSHAVKLIAVY